MDPWPRSAVGRLKVAAFVRAVAEWAIGRLTAAAKRHRRLIGRDRIGRARRIDLRDERNKRKLFEEMKHELRKDRAKFSILPMDEYGLIELTRERIRPSIMFSLSEPCPACTGTGRVGNRTTLYNKIDRWTRRFKHDHRFLSRLQFVVHPDIIDQIEPKMKKMRRTWMRHKHAN
jgi:Ribonuclease G/E